MEVQRQRILVAEAMKAAARAMARDFDDDALDLGEADAALEAQLSEAIAKTAASEAQEQERLPPKVKAR